MSLFKIAWRSIQQRSLASTLTAFSMALGVMLVVAVLVVGHVVADYFRTGAGLGYNLVVGKKGSDIQLVMNTVYYLDRPIENIPWSYYKEFLSADQRADKQEGQFARWVDKAVPVNLGDYHEGFKVIGTTPAMFGELELQPGKPFEFAAGENFTQDEYFSAVIGYGVFEATGLSVNDVFTPTHAAPDGHTHDEKFRITGVLARTGTPIDRALYVNIEGFFLLRGHALEDAAALAAAQKPDSVGGLAESDRNAHEPITIAPGGAATKGTHKHAAGRMHSHDGGKPHTHDHAHGHGHDHAHHHEPLAENLREVTAILVRTTGGAPEMPPEVGAQQIFSPINKDVVAQAVAPIQVIYQFMERFLTPLRFVLLVLTVLVVVVSAISILVSIYNSMAERQHEIAVMRALGAGRGTVMLILLLESILLAIAGGLVGWLMGHGMLSLVAPWISQRAGVSISPLQFAPGELWLIPGIILLASLVGFLPAWTAYRTDVAKSLTANP